MTRPPRQRAIYVLSILFGVAPFAFGLIRAVAARDLRLLWMAFVAFVGAVVVRTVARSRARPPTDRRVAAATFVISTLLAAAMAYLLGATATAGVWPVAVVLGLCLAASYTCYELSRLRTR